jgi:hypothetical protein
MKKFSQLVFTLFTFLVFGLFVQTASAQDSGKLEWKGTVDADVQLIIRGRNIETRVIAGSANKEVIYKFDKTGLPRVDVRTEFKKKKGRGDVSLIQQPVAANNYTAIVRIIDDKGGPDKYEFELKWKVTGSQKWSEKDFNNGYRYGQEDFKTNQTPNYRRYNDKYKSKEEASFRSGYQEGYDTARANSAGGSMNEVERSYYDDGFRLGQDDYRVGLSRNHARYGNRYDSRYESFFRRGYEAGYDGGRGQGSTNTVRPMNLYQTGRGVLDITGRQREQLVRATVILRENRDVEITLYRENGSTIRFGGRLAAIDAYKLYVQLTNSGNANADGNAEIAYGNNESISSLNMNGRLDGQQFFVDFTR